MHPRQKEFAAEIMDGSAFYYIVNTSRQFGKSFMLKELLTMLAVRNRWQCMFVSMTYPQVQTVETEFFRALRPSGLVVSFNKSEHEMELLNGSIIRFRSYQKPDSSRGYHNNLLIVDEAAYMDSDAWNEVYLPTLSTAGKKCILTSTPHGKNFFYDMWLQGQGGNPKYRSWTATYRDNPLANIDIIEDARKVMSERHFRQEFLAEFIDGASCAFAGYRDCVNIDAKPGRTVAGLDIGRQNDYTVLTIMQGGKVIHIGRWREQTWDSILNSVISDLRQYAVERVWYEVNGIGDPVGEMFRTMARRSGLAVHVLPWTTTNTTKVNAIEQLIADFQRKTISIPDNRELLLELDNFEASYSTASRCLKYEARSGMHDDMVMSLAIVNYNRNQIHTFSVV